MEEKGQLSSVHPPEQPTNRTHSLLVPPRLSRLRLARKGKDFEVFGQESIGEDSPGLAGEFREVLIPGRVMGKDELLNPRPFGNLCRLPGSEMMMFFCEFFISFQIRAFTEKEFGSLRNLHSPMAIGSVNHNGERIPFVNGADFVKSDAAPVDVQLFFLLEQADVGPLNA